MSGTEEGGKKAAETNKQRYGADWYAKIGEMGGKTLPSTPRGFAAMSPEKRSAAGKIGGRKSRRNKVEN